MQGLRLDYFYLVAVDLFVSYLKQNNRINHNVDTAIQSQLLQPSYYFITGLVYVLDSTPYCLLKHINQCL